MNLSSSFPANHIIPNIEVFLFSFVSESTDDLEALMRDIERVRGRERERERIRENDYFNLQNFPLWFKDNSNNFYCLFIISELTTEILKFT